MLTITLTHHLPALDISGAILGLVATVAFIRISILAWPLSIMGLIVDIALYWQRGIYADTALNFIYLIMVIYGWYHWLRGGKNHQKLSISHITKTEIAWLMPLCVAVILSVAWFLKTYTNSTIPYFDAITTVLSLTAQWLTCRKVLENWLVWLVADGLFIGLYFYKGIPAHALLNIVYLGLAVVGYWSWRKKLLAI